MVALLVWYTSKWQLSNFLDGTKFETNKIFWPADQPSKCYKKYRISCVRKYIWYGHYTCTRQHKILLDFVCTLIELGESRIQCTVIHLCITTLYFRLWSYFCSFWSMGQVQYTTQVPRTESIPLRTATMMNIIEYQIE